MQEVSFAELRTFLCSRTTVSGFPLSSFFPLP